MTLAVNDIRFGRAGLRTRREKCHLIMVAVTISKLTELQESNVNASVMILYRLVVLIQNKQTFLNNKRCTTVQCDARRHYKPRQGSNKSMFGYQRNIRSFLKNNMQGNILIH